MTDRDRCTQTYPHPTHRRSGLPDCPGVPITPANAPDVPPGPALASALPTMNADRLATFGRWAFFAGLVYAFTLVAIGRVVHWPDWLGAAVSFAAGSLAIWQIERLAERAAINGRCGTAAPAVSWASHSPRPVCALPHGHAGWHRADDGCEWGPINNRRSSE